MEFMHNCWLLRLDDKGNLTHLYRDGFIVLAQSGPMMTLVVDGVSALNNQSQMHNIDLYTVVGEKPKLLSCCQDGEQLIVKQDVGSGFTLTYFYEMLPRWVTLKVEIGYYGGGKHKLRWMNWNTYIPHAEGELFAPGYTPNRGEPYDLHRPMKDYRHEEILTHDLFGEHVPAYRPGFLGAYLPERKMCACTWFISEMMPCYTPSLSHVGDDVYRRAEVHCARWMQDGDTQMVETFFFGTEKGSREECVKALVQSYEPYHWAGKKDRKRLRNMRILELHLGNKSNRVLFDSFAQVEEKLDEIQKMGFNTIEVMPRMPFPSYSVFDLSDIDITYGGQEALVSLARNLHKRGMKIILDMVFHGPLEYDSALGLPRSPYLDEHPDWFMRHDSGCYARTYTRSFDMGNPDYIAHIGDCMEKMIDVVGADGFRLDAQMWSETPNWDRNCPRKPYESVLAGMRMMDEISARIHAHHPDVVFYTEANGPYSAKSHELRYNYDCHWLYPALCPVVDRRGAPPHVLNYASMATMKWSDAAMWLTEMQLTSPEGMAIMFQTDSHDSCEWGGYPGGQYNREAYGEDMHRALYALVNCLDGGLMSFYGAQQGNEDFYAELAAKMRDDVMQGECSYTAVTCEDAKTVLIQWKNEKVCRLVVINLERKAKTVHTDRGEEIELEPCEVKFIDQVI